MTLIFSKRPKNKIFLYQNATTNFALWNLIFLSFSFINRPTTRSPTARYNYIIPPWSRKKARQRNTQWSAKTTTQWIRPWKRTWITDNYLSVYHFHTFWLQELDRDQNKDPNLLQDQDQSLDLDQATDQATDQDQSLDLDQDRDLDRDLALIFCIIFICCPTMKVNGLQV